MRIALGEADFEEAAVAVAHLAVVVVQITAMIAMIPGTIQNMSTIGHPGLIVLEALVALVLVVEKLL